MDLGWAHLSNEVAYIYQPGDGEFSLIRASTLNTNKERLVLHLDKQGMKDPYLEWTKDDENLLISDKDIYVYNFYDRALNKLTKTKTVKWARLSGNGQYIIFADGDGLNLMRLDGTGKQKLDTAAEIGEWLANGNQIIVLGSGKLKVVDLQSGKVTEYGYNGPKLKDIKALTIAQGDDDVYYLTKDNVLKKLKLQPAREEKQ
jgi:hypothetical protein